jgi:hypothetical protein
MHVPIWVIVVVSIVFACVVIYAIAMHFVARGASEVIDGIVKGFRR